MASPKAKALRAAGTTFELSDGTPVTLRYSMASIVQIEETFGNLGALATSVQDAALAAQYGLGPAQQASMSVDELEAAAGYTGPSLFKVLVDALAPGLLEEQVTDPRSGDVVWVGEHPDVLARMLDLAHLQDYLAAFSEAFGEAFRAVAGGDAAHPAKTGSASQTTSRGTSGGTSRSAAAGTPRKRSGA